MGYIGAYWVYGGILGYIGVYWDILGYIGVYWDILGIWGILAFEGGEMILQTGQNQNHSNWGVSRKFISPFQSWKNKILPKISIIPLN